MLVLVWTVLMLTMVQGLSIASIVLQFSLPASVVCGTLWSVVIGVPIISMIVVFLRILIIPIAVFVMFSN